MSESNIRSELETLISKYGLEDVLIILDSIRKELKITQKTTRDIVRLQRRCAIYQMKSDGKSLDEVATTFGITRERVRQVIKTHIRQLFWEREREGKGLSPLSKSIRCSCNLFSEDDYIKSEVEKRIEFVEKVRENR